MKEKTDTCYIKIPEAASYIIKTIREAGFEAFVVGGCVRDALLGKEPEDWDITTSALPEQIKALFRRTVDTGIAHGTVTVLIKNESFEITTYRIDGDYEDSRHPKSVSFTGQIEEDLKRRDFTINAMAYDSDQGLIDLFGGLEDLKNKLIRCVGNPTDRFSEDALRIMRAVRFSAQLGFDIENNTTLAMKALSGNLSNISAERIQTELIKLLVSPHPERLQDAYTCGITGVFFPEFDTCMATDQNHPHHKYSVGEHIIHTLMEAPDDRIIRLSLLFHDIAKPLCLTVGEDGFTHFHGHAVKGVEITKAVLKRLKFDNNTTRQVLKLVEFHDNNPSLSKKSVRRLLNKLGSELFDPLMAVKRADILAQSEFKREDKLTYLDSLTAMGHSVIESMECFSIKDLAVNGSDLIGAGIPKGPLMGDILESLLNLVMDDQSLNNKEELIKQSLVIYKDL